MDVSVVVVSVYLVQRIVANLADNDSGSTVTFTFLLHACIQSYNILMPMWSSLWWRYSNSYAEVMGVIETLHQFCIYVIATNC